MDTADHLIYRVYTSHRMHCRCGYPQSSSKAAVHVGLKHAACWAALCQRPLGSGAVHHSPSCAADGGTVHLGGAGAVGTGARVIWNPPPLPLAPPHPHPQMPLFPFRGQTFQKRNLLPVKRATSGWTLFDCLRYCETDLLLLVTGRSVGMDRLVRRLG